MEARGCTGLGAIQLTGLKMGTCAASRRGSTTRALMASSVPGSGPMSTASTILSGCGGHKVLWALRI
jgi:hypothetical protein